MTTTPPPMPEPIAWHEYARKKPSLKRLVFDRTSPKDLRVAGWVSEALIEAASVEARDAQWMERITALEADRKMLREALTVAVTQNEHDMLMTGDELRAASNVLRNTHDN
jgi:hypothetical protein